MLDLWNNIVKIGNAYKGFPNKLYDDGIKNNMKKVIPIEIEILKPDFIVFFTGPNSSNGLYDNVLCEIILPNVKKCFRLYHPKYLDFRKKNDNIDYINTFKIITSEILKCKRKM